MEGPWWQDGNRLDSLVRSTLALVVVVAAGAFVFGYWPGVATEVAQGRAAIVMGVVGAVLGYYFGTRGVESADARAREVAAEARVSAARQENRVEMDARREMDEALASLQEYREIIVNAERFMREAGIEEKFNDFLGGIKE